MIFRRVAEQIRDHVVHAQLLEDLRAETEQLLTMIRTDLGTRS